MRQGHLVPGPSGNTNIVYCAGIHALLKKKRKKHEILRFYSIFFFLSLDFFGLLLLTTRKMYRLISMNIEEDFAVTAARLCSLILFPVLDEDEDIDECRFFLNAVGIF